MSGLKAFFKQNRKKVENVKIVASEDFVGEDGKPLEWEVRPLRPKEADALREETTTYDENGKPRHDTATFNCKMVVKCVVFPNLNDAELQDSYGVMGAEELVREMFERDGEYQKFIQKILKINGYGDSDKKLVNEAKNS